MTDSSKGTLLEGTRLVTLAQNVPGSVAAALEPHFWERLLIELGLEGTTSKEDLAEVLRRETAKKWERWAAERDLPVGALRDAPAAHTTIKEA